MDPDDEEENEHVQVSLSLKDVKLANEVIDHFHKSIGNSKKKYKNIIIHAALTQIIHTIMIAEDIGNVEHGIKDDTLYLQRKTAKDIEVPSYIR